MMTGWLLFCGKECKSRKDVGGICGECGREKMGAI